MFEIAHDMLFFLGTLPLIAANLGILGISTYVLYCRSNPENKTHEASDPEDETHENSDCENDAPNVQNTFEIENVLDVSAREQATKQYDIVMSELRQRFIARQTIDTIIEGIVKKQQRIEETKQIAKELVDNMIKEVVAKIAAEETERMLAEQQDIEHEITAAQDTLDQVEQALDECVTQPETDQAVVKQQDTLDPVEQALDECIAQNTLDQVEQDFSDDNSSDDTKQSDEMKYWIKLPYVENKPSAYQYHHDEFSDITLFNVIKHDLGDYIDSNSDRYTVECTPSTFDQHETPITDFLVKPGKGLTDFSFINNNGRDYRFISLIEIDNTEKFTTEQCDTIKDIVKNCTAVGNSKILIKTDFKKLVVILYYASGNTCTDAKIACSNFLQRILLKTKNRKQLSLNAQTVLVFKVPIVI